MLMPHITLDMSSAGAPAGEPVASGTGEAAAGSERFADQLALAQSALPTGQNLAAGALPLQTLTLGPGLEVLTTPAGSPDGDSLAEFARAQGLDEDVVAWLFSDTTQSLMALPVTPSGLMVLPGTTPGAPGAWVDPAGGITLASYAGAPANTPLLTAMSGAAGLPGTLVPDTALTALPDTAGLPAVPLNALPASPLGVGPGAGAASLPPLPGQPLAVTPTPAGASTEAELAAAAAAVLGTAGWLQSQAVTHRLAGGSASPDPTQVIPTLLPQSLMATAAAAVRGARADSASDPSRLASAQTPVEILTLDVQPGLEALWDDPAESGTSSGSGTGSAPGHTASAQAPSDDATPESALAQRAANYQALSQRLGEVLAQRMMAQIERGNWEVRLLLRPARLGEIEVDLSLRSGALDASFRATNPVTRDLLNDGLPRLREVLADAGMDIAGMNVGSGRSQQTGGNPTPRHAHAPQGTEVADRGLSAPVAPASQPRPRGAGESGWDVLV
jgi:hypothetical protein